MIIITVNVINFYFYLIIFYKIIYLANSNIKKIFNIDEHIEFGNKKAEDFVNRRKSKISKPNEKFQWTMKKIEENSDLDINMLLDYFKTIN